MYCRGTILFAIIIDCCVIPERQPWQIFVNNIINDGKLTIQRFEVKLCTKLNAVRNVVNSSSDYVWYTLAQCVKNVNYCNKIVQAVVT